MSFQKTNAYNRFLPFSSTALEADADRFLAEIKVNLRRSVTSGDLGRGGAIKWINNLYKYTVLYGLRLTKEDHVFFIKVAFQLFCTKDLDSISLDEVKHTS